MFMDARELRGADVLAYDLVIVGAGMAGITIADRLRPSGARVCLLEAGGVDPELSAQRLYQGASVGRPYFGLDRCRFRVLGGSSVLWGGWSRPLDPDDFDARDWIALSGWPITAGELAPDYARAARLLGLETDSFAAADWGMRLPPPPPIGAPEFEPGIIQHGRVDFGERFGSSLAAAENVTVLLHANVTELRSDRHGARIDEAVVATLAGSRLTVRAAVFVLAAGGIENPRLLLASRSSRPDGIGNESDFVGRCFMDHLHVASGYVDPADGEGLPSFFEHPIGGTSAAHGMLVPTPPEPSPAPPPDVLDQPRRRALGVRRDPADRLASAAHHRTGRGLPPPGARASRAQRTRPPGVTGTLEGRAPTAGGAARLPRRPRPTIDHAVAVHAGRADAQPRQPDHPGPAARSTGGCAAPVGLADRCAGPRRDAGLA